jgi:hypothetical protein
MRLLAISHSTSYDVFAYQGTHGILVSLPATVIVIVRHLKTSVERPSRGHH